MRTLELSEGGVDAVLSVHSGLGVGQLTAFRVGSAAHSEFLVTGDVIRQQVATAMNTAKKRECVLSREAWDVVRQAGLVSAQPTGDESAGCQLLNSVAEDDDGVVREDDHAARAAIRAAGNALDADDRRGRRASSADAPGVLGGDGSSDAAWLRRTLRTSGLLELQCARDLHDVLHAQPSDEALLRAYVHPVAAKAIQAGGGASGQTLATRVAELRRDIIVAFVKVDGLEEQLSKPTPSAPDSPAATFPTEATAAIDAASSEALLAHDLTVVQSCLDAAHGAIARHGGMLRQFVIDDKGAVIIWCFGLPGCAFEDNARRGLRSSFDVVDALLALGLSPRVGITLGQTFCGLVGAPYRCEYAVMGPCVNLAARLMGKCYKFNARVLCNDELREKLGAQRAKGEIAEYFFTAQVGRPDVLVKAHFSFSGCAPPERPRRACARARGFRASSTHACFSVSQVGFLPGEGIRTEQSRVLPPRNYSRVSRYGHRAATARRAVGAPTQTTAQLSPSQKTSRPALRATFVSRHRALSVDGRRVRWASRPLGVRADGRAARRGRLARARARRWCRDDPRDAGHRQVSPRRDNASVLPRCGDERRRLSLEVGEPAQGGRDGAAHALAVWRPVLLDALRVHLGLLPLAAALPVPVSHVVGLLPPQLKWAHASLPSLLSGAPTSNGAASGGSGAGEDGNGGIPPAPPPTTVAATEDADAAAAARPQALALEAELVVTLLETVFASHACVVILDNMQNAGRPAWEMLARLAAGGARPAALFVVATRPLSVWVEGGEPLEYQELLAQPWTSAITLGPIAARACARIVSDELGERASPALAVRVHARCGGNPLFIKQTLSQIQQDFIDAKFTGARRIFAPRWWARRLADLEILEPPGGLRTLVLAQLDRQALAEQILVKMACVLGSSRAGETQAPFERHRLQELFPGSVGALDSALLSLSAGTRSRWWRRTTCATASTRRGRRRHLRIDAQGSARAHPHAGRRELRARVRSTPLGRARAQARGCSRCSLITCAARISAPRRWVSRRCRPREARARATGGRASLHRGARAPREESYGDGGGNVRGGVRQSVTRPMGLLTARPRARRTARPTRYSGTHPPLARRELLALRRRE